MSGRFDVDIVVDWSQLNQLKGEWDLLAAPQETEPWLSFSWVAACADTYNRALPLHVITAREAGRLIGVAPLALTESRQPLRPPRLEFVGGDDLKEPNGFLARDPSTFEALTDALVAEQTYPIRLSRVPADSGGTDHLVASFRQRGWVSKTISMPYPYLHLDRADGLISKSLKSDLSRGRRKAVKRGEVTIERVRSSSAEGFESRVRDAFLIEASGWKGRNKTAILYNEARRRFFERLADAAGRDGTLRLTFLKIGSADVAVHYALEAAKAYWLLNIGYRDDYRECSPGNLLLQQTIDESAHDGLNRYNFLGKEESWTRRWTSEVRDCLVVAAYRPNYYGFRAVLSDALYLLQKWRRDQRVRKSKKVQATSS